jgi:hypothetical protein
MSDLVAELETIDLRDQRLNERARRVLADLGAQPGRSIPAACGGWPETKGAYRLFDHEQVTAQQVLEPHYLCSEQRLRQHPVVLCLQDTSELDYTGKSDIQGLGPLNYETRQGLYLHPTLAVTPERLALGVLDAWMWTREPGSLGADKDRHRPIEEKESLRWLEGYQRVCELQTQMPETRLVYVGDREADIYDLFAERYQARQAEAVCAEWLIRAEHDRKLADGRKLQEAAAEAPVLARVEFEMPATDTRQARHISQTLQAVRVTLKAPYRPGRVLPDVEVTALLAQEEHPPAGEEPIAWLLLTSLAVETAEQAIEQLQWYLCRWQIGVSGEGHIIQSVKVRPRLTDSGLVAWEAPWRESKTVKPSDNVHRGCTATPQVVTCSERRSSLVTRIPVAETGYNARRQQGPIETSPRRRSSPAGYQRRHDAKDYVATGEALGARWRKPAEEVSPITVSGKWRRRHQGGGSGRSTDDRRAAKRASREGPGPVGIALLKVR